MNQTRRVRKGGNWFRWTSKLTAPPPPPLQENLILTTEPQEKKLGNLELKHNTLMKQFTKIRKELNIIEGDRTQSFNIYTTQKIDGLYDKLEDIAKQIQSLESQIKTNTKTLKKNQKKVKEGIQSGVIGVNPLFQHKSNVNATKEKAINLLKRLNTIGFAGGRRTKKQKRPRGHRGITRRR